MNKVLSLVAAAIVVMPSLANAQSLAGKWEGSLSAGGMSLDITVNFQGTGDAISATIDIPAQGAIAVPLLIESHEHPKITFVINGVPGTPKFDGTHEADSITGAFTQGGASGEFRLVRSGASDSAPNDVVQVVRSNASGARSGSTPVAVAPRT